VELDDGLSELVVVSAGEDLLAHVQNLTRGCITQALGDQQGVCGATFALESLG
jgi:hypothetical protein